MNNIPELRFSGFKEPRNKLHLEDVADRVIRKNLHLETKIPLTISAEKGLVDQLDYYNNRVASKDISGYYLIENGEFAYNKSTSKDAPYGAIKRLDLYDNGALSTLYIVFNITRGNKDYFKYYFESAHWHKEIYKIAQEGARNHGLLNLSVSDFFEIKISAPGLEEQEKIGDLFSKIDALIEKQEGKVSKMEDFKKSMLQKIFPKKGELVPDFRFEGFDGEWKKVLINELLDYEQPTKYIVSSEDYIEDGTPVLTANKSFLLGYTNEKNIYDKGEVILIDDFTLDNKYVDFPFMVKSSALKILTEKKSDLFFVYNLLNNIDFISEGHKRHYISVVQNIKVLVPSIEEQQKIGQFFKNLDTQIEAEEKLLESYKQMKKSLLQKMFV